MASVFEPFESAFGEGLTPLLPGRTLSPQVRQEADLLDQLWEAELEELYDRCQIRGGSRVLVYDCGLGHDLPRLARRVGTLGEVVAVQPDPFLAHEVRQNLKERQVPRVRVVLAHGEDPIPPSLFDVIFLAWRGNPTQPGPGMPERVRDLLQRLRPWLSAQGRLAIWEECRHGMQLYPALPLLERTLRRWQRRRPPSVPRVPGLAAEFAYSGVLWESARPVQKADVPGSPTARWFDNWLQQQGPAWVEASLLSARRWELLQQQWESRRVNPGTLYFSPQALSVVGRALS